MIPLRYTRNLFLRAFCIIYLSAFLSFYFQIPGLYGDNGILPAKSLLENSKHKTLSAKIHYQPTLLWLSSYLGLDINYALDVLALLGAFLAFTGFVSQKFCIIPVFTALWSLYFSLYQIGQVFVSHSFDELLLEAGFLAILVAPFFPHKKGQYLNGSNLDNITFCLVRWLLFRYLLTTGLSKLISGCPKWWSLIAFNHHFETMPLPSPLAWYSHHIPSWQLKLVNVFANFCEILLPFLFFIPIRAVRLTAFVIQLFLQTCIVLTGNFDFHNLLMVTLLLSLLDDQFFYGRKKPNSKWGILGNSLNIGIYAGVIYGLTFLYNFKYNNGIVETKINFTKSQFDHILTNGLVLTSQLGLLSLGLTCIYSIYRAFSENSKNSSTFVDVTKTFFLTIVSLLLLSSSTVPLSSLNQVSNSTVDPNVRQFYNRLHKMHAVNQYGLFKQMTGIDGRPEIIIEGSDSIEGPWSEYYFLYKPGNVNHSMPFVAPYAPKLDWEMYWAARSTYEKQPWILSLTHRLLIGRPEVLILLDQQHTVWAKKTPKYIRGSLYKYKYTKWSQKGQWTWWTRERVGDYFPAYSKDSPALLEFLKARNLLPIAIKSEVNPLWKQILDSVRYVSNRLEATLIFWSVFTAGLAIISTTSPKRG